VQKIENVQDIEIRWAGWLDDAVAWSYSPIYLLYHFFNGKKMQNEIKTSSFAKWEIQLHTVHTALGALGVTGYIYR